MEVQVFGDGISRVAVRAITPDIYWITHCLGDHAKAFYDNYFEALPDHEAYTYHQNVDYPFSAFLIVDEKSLLIDTGAPTQRENTLRAIQHVLGDKQLDYIWISHIELPHAGNSGALKQLYLAAKLVTLSDGDHYYALHGLDDALRVAPGDVIELGRHTLEMVDAVFVDHGFSQWAYERTTGFFFPADWGHNLHDAARGQCFQFVDEMLAETGYTTEQYVEDVKVNAWYQFPWLTFSDADEICAAIDKLFDQYDVKIFAPSHGNIIRKDMDKVAHLLKDGMRQAAEMPYYFGLS